MITQGEEGSWCSKFSRSSNRNQNGNLDKVERSYDSGEHQEQRIRIESEPRGHVMNVVQL